MEFQEIRVLDATGKTVQTHDGLFTGQAELSLVGLLPGQYVVLAGDASGRWATASFVKL
jgi:hypothetical protein